MRSVLCESAIDPRTPLIPTLQPSGGARAACRSEMPAGSSSASSTESSPMARCPRTRPSEASAFAKLLGASRAAERARGHTSAQVQRFRTGRGENRSQRRCPKGLGFRALVCVTEECFVVLYRNFRSLPLLGFIGFLNKAAKSLIFVATLLSAAKIAGPCVLISQG